MDRMIGTSARDCLIPYGDHRIASLLFLINVVPLASSDHEPDCEVAGSDNMVLHWKIVDYSLYVRVGCCSKQMSLSI